MTSISYYDSPLGRLLIKASDAALKGVWFVGQKHFPKELVNMPPLNSDCEIICLTQQWLDEYFAGLRPEISRLRLAPEGSDFRLTVWDILCTIPYGASMSYGQIAAMIGKNTGKRMSAQAVGGAVGHNPISIIIPCHRVLGADGSLTGYAGGLDKKLFLLSHEGILS